MFTSGREHPDLIAVEPGGPASDLKRSRTTLFIGVYMVAVGVLLQWLVPTTTLTCRQHASPTASCVVSKRIVLGLLPAGSEHIADLRGARTVARTGIKRRASAISYRVVLDTAAGEHRFTWSNSFEAAYALDRTINQRLTTGAPFEVSLGFAFLDWSMRAVGLLTMAAGATFAGLGRSRLRRAQSTAAQESH